MSMWKRAWYYITRKKKKSVIMFLLLFLIATALVSGIAVRQAVASIKNEMNQNIKAGLLMEPAEKESGKIIWNDAEKVRKSKGISGYQYDLQTMAKLTEGKLVEMQQGIIMDDSFLEEYENLMTVCGSTDSAQNHDFISRKLQLTEGRHIQPSDTGKVLLHEAFAKQNGYHVGSKVKFADKAENEKSRELEVVGLFRGSAGKQTIIPSETSENTVFTDLESAQQFSGEREKFIDTATYYVENPKQITFVKEEIQKLPLDWNTYQLSDNADSYKGILSSADNMEKMIEITIAGIIGVSVLILSLVLIFWIQGRIHETGIMLSVGISKLQIVMQYILEIALIAVLSFGLAYFSGKAAGQTVGKQIAMQAEENVVDGSEEAGAAEMEIPVSWKEMATVYAAGLGIIVLSVGISSIAIIRLKPKEILSKMS